MTTEQKLKAFEVHLQKEFNKWDNKRFYEGSPLITESVPYNGVRKKKNNLLPKPIEPEIDTIVCRGKDIERLKKYFKTNN